MEGVSEERTEGDQGPHPGLLRGQTVRGTGTCSEEAERAAAERWEEACDVGSSRGRRRVRQAGGGRRGTAVSNAAGRPRTDHVANWRSSVMFARTVSAWE